MKLSHQFLDDIDDLRHLIKTGEIRWSWQVHKSLAAIIAREASRTHQRSVRACLMHIENNPLPVERRKK